MWYHNLKYFDAAEGFVPGALRVEDGMFREVVRGTKPPAAGSVDLGGALVIPGLVDIHVHGAAGADFSDGDEAGLRRMARHLASRGITGFLPTSMTLPQEVLARAFRTASAVQAENDPAEARVLGIHMEGPFLSKEKRGAQDESYLRAPDLDEFRELQKVCGGMIRIVDVAPELSGAEGFVRGAAGSPGAEGFVRGAPEDRQHCIVSIAHTAADYRQAGGAFEAGASHLGHLFNGMAGFHHREPGVIGAAAERENVTAELIADGFHVHPSAVRMAFRLFPGRICLVSDALRSCGMAEAGNGPVMLEDGTIAGAASDLMTDLRNAIAFGIPVEQAIAAATIDPARVAGWDDRIGSIEEGKYADFLICEEDLRLRQVVLRGGRL